MQDEFKYFNFLVLFVLAVYTGILAIFLRIRRKEIRHRRLLGGDDSNTGSSLKIKLTTRFEETFESNWTYTYSTHSILQNSNVVLASTRFLSLSFFVGLSFYLVIPKSEDVGTAIYFSLSNLVSLLVTLYFALASVASLAGIFGTWRSNAGRNPLIVNTQFEDSVLAVAVNEEWSKYHKYLGVATHILFEVAGATALCACAFDLFFANSDVVSLPGLKYYYVYVVIFATLQLELLQNSMEVRFDQYPATMGMLMLYFLAVWPAVFSGSLRTWPYTFLSTGGMLCFLNYGLVILANFGFYLAWYSSSKLKWILVRHLRAQEAADQLRGRAMRGQGGFLLGNRQSNALFVAESNVVSPPSNREYNRSRMNMNNASLYNNAISSIARTDSNDNDDGDQSGSNIDGYELDDREEDAGETDLFIDSSPFPQHSLFADSDSDEPEELVHQSPSPLDHVSEGSPSLSSAGLPRPVHHRQRRQPT